METLTPLPYWEWKEHQRKAEPYLSYSQPTWYSMYQQHVKDCKAVKRVRYGIPKSG